MSVLVRGDTRALTFMLMLTISLSPSSPQQAHTEERACEDMVRRWLSASQEESSAETGRVGTLILDF